MAGNEDFVLEILIGGIPMPIYTSKEGKLLVEANLSTRVSYKVDSLETVNGEVERQKWPVTPYQIRLTSLTEEESYYRVFVDGIKVKGLGLKKGENKTIKGFKDGRSIKEFLFSMPALSKSLNGLEDERTKLVGKISCQCFNANLRRSKTRLRNAGLDFEQASKKDALKVTKGQYTMATSKPGSVVSRREIKRKVNLYRVASMRSEIVVEYHMSHTLQEMGIKLQPFPTYKPSRTETGLNDVKSESKNLREARKKDVILNPVMVDLTETSSEDEIYVIETDTEVTPSVQMFTMKQDKPLEIETSDTSETRNFETESTALYCNTSKVIGDLRIVAGLDATKEYLQQSDN